MKEYIAMLALANNLRGIHVYLVMANHTMNPCASEREHESAEDQ